MENPKLIFDLSVNLLLKEVFILKLLMCEKVLITWSKSLSVWMVNLVRDFKLKMILPNFWRRSVMCVTAFTCSYKVPSRDCFWITIYFVLGLLAISPPQRTRCVVGREGDWGGGKRKTCRGRYEGKRREERSFPLLPSFLIIAIFCWNTQRELCVGERCLHQRASINKMHFL